MKKKLLLAFDIIIGIYFLLGIIFIKIDIVDNPLFGFYFTTFMFMPLVYIVFGCLCYKHKNLVMNIIDGALCYILTAIFPYPVCSDLYIFNAVIYNILGICFSFLPLLFCIIDKEKVNIITFLKVVVRILMIIFTVYVLLILNSCGTA